MDSKKLAEPITYDSVDLKKLAEPMPYKWRVQAFSRNKPAAACVAYIEARDVMDRLDEVCGPGNWQVKYYTVNDLLFCAIGIKIGDEWVWKADTGTESNMEAEKGHVSDAFKRAAVHWGIGRFLYRLEIVYVKANVKKTHDNYPYVIDADGRRVNNLTAYINELMG